jgi:hypothetical protein
MPAVCLLSSFSLSIFKSRQCTLALGASPLKFHLQLVHRLVHKASSLCLSTQLFLQILKLGSQIHIFHFELLNSGKHLLLGLLCSLRHIPSFFLACQEIPVLVSDGLQLTGECAELAPHGYRILVSGTSHFQTPLKIGTLALELIPLRLHFEVELSLHLLIVAGGRSRRHETSIQRQHG